MYGHYHMYSVGLVQGDRLAISVEIYYPHYTLQVRVKQPCPVAC